MNRGDGINHGIYPTYYPNTDDLTPYRFWRTAPGGNMYACNGPCPNTVVVPRCRELCYGAPHYFRCMRRCQYQS